MTVNERGARPARSAPAARGGQGAGDGRAKGSGVTSRFIGTTLAGVLATIVLLWFVVSAGGSWHFYYNPEGLVIVLGGVVCVALLAFRGDEIRAALGALVGIVRDRDSIRADVAELMEVARPLYEKRIQAADERAQRVSHPFLRLGLQMVVDGQPLEDLLQVMNWRIQKQMELEAGQSRFFRTLATFSPAFGLLGTLAGMVGMLKHLGEGDIGLIGASMAVAMLATLYGLILANLVFKPIAIKLEQRTGRRVALMNVLLEGVVLTHLGRSPTLIQDSLDHYLRDAREEDWGGA
ncbi:motility protein A [Nitrospirillum pindoramense]|uniref:Chemotaxis protein MotA n=1 Tax=Nitrospirillum amazonense TaxID=28077 RepID=A0A560H6E2_9PROT|nr:MotA/TolQ/ExbB proton channel family protein [Nitrospirillum amazonense]TWB41721.1 chemotaxis protein MotA [Nitrospirillum amazonense]